MCMNQKEKIVMQSNFISWSTKEKSDDPLLQMIKTKQSFHSMFLFTHIHILLFTVSSFKDLRLSERYTFFAITLFFQGL